MLHKFASVWANSRRRHTFCHCFATCHFFNWSRSEIKIELSVIELSGTDYICSVAQVQLATELSAATAQLTTLQLEVSNLNKREAELQKQIDLSTSTGNQNKHEINELKSQNTGNGPLTYSVELCEIKTK